MNYIDSVTIEGFWGNKTLHIPFKDDVNFIIGSNGSGKTTAINMIAAALKADIPALYAASFDKITIKLKNINDRKKPSIEVVKNVDGVMGNVELKFYVKDKASDKPRVFGVEGPYDERIYRDPRLTRYARLKEEGARLGSVMSEMVEVNWLSIHRASVDVIRKWSREEQFESSIDHKLIDISRAFANYFSLLSAKWDVETKNFQEQTFLSLLRTESNAMRIFQGASSEVENKDSLISVLTDLKVQTAKANKSVSAFYKRLSEAREQIQPGRGVRLEDAIVLADEIRIGEMVVRWKELQNKKEKIYRPRYIFEEIINSLFSGKKLNFDQRNTPKVILSDGQEASISGLSSGEKQLFILLGEALLQENRPVVFISDEPELSLHVNWQSALFKNIRALNGSCQVITATHSPDIVGKFQDRVIKIEECFV